MKTTAEHMLDWMKRNGVTRYRLVHEVGIPSTTVHRILSGDRIGQLNTWVKIANYFGCSVSDLIGDNYDEDCVLRHMRGGDIGTVPHSPDEEEDPCV